MGIMYIKMSLHTFFYSFFDLSHILQRPRNPEKPLTIHPMLFQVHKTFLQKQGAFVGRPLLHVSELASKYYHQLSPLPAELLLGVMKRGNEIVVEVVGVGRK